VEVDDADITHFATFGFVVLRAAFDARPLSDEVDEALRHGSRSSFASTVARGRYVPMMTERTPVSLSLLDRCAELAAALLSAPVLPVRAKCVQYTGSTAWHADSERSLASIGFAAYLEPLGADDGALRVLPGSHCSDFAHALRSYPALHDVGALPGFVVATEPGDLIVLDEHLHHASAGGATRRQWRVDYVIDPVDPEQEEKVRSYYADVYALGWDGGYDAEAFPTYGSSWHSSGRACLERLTALGAHAAATAQEAAFA
jgi:Phytanoyl-CoA dioxygenase (PhyH)